jgi:molybdopterin-containing oxidoreductase family iron-sulfur binding subunit
MSGAASNSPAAAPRYWRSLAAREQRAEFLQSLQPEFSAPSTTAIDAVSRRGFLKMVGATAALSGLVACTREPVQKIVPYVKQPEEIVPGKPLHYATAMTHGGFAMGILVESHEGHPTKIEGNPTHPSSLGATGIFQQAALYDLYDPDRARAITSGGEGSNLASFQAALEQAMAGPRAERGRGLRILTQSITSSTLTAQLEELLKQFPEARWHQYQPMARDNTLAGAKLVFGRPVETRLHFDRARIVVGLDADFFFTHPDGVVYARRFTDAREPGRDMSRFYAVEPSPSTTGAVADHRLAASAAEIERLAFELASEMGLPLQRSPTPLPERHREWMSALVEDLRSNPGQSIIVAGETQPPQVHALVHLLNHRLGNRGKTTTHADSAETHWVAHLDSIAELRRDLAAGAVTCLIILGGNPVFDAPADLDFADALANVKHTFYLGGEDNETSAACGWHMPESHFLESWGDARAFNGTTSIVQPLISPLYDTHTATQLLHWILHRENRSDYDILRDHWSATRSDGADFETWWRKSLHDGVIAGTELPTLAIEPLQNLPALSGPSASTNSNALEICFRPDPCLWDGRYANNGWLQELPKPFSKVTWDNPALVSPALAHRLQSENGDLVKLEVSGRSQTFPVWITPGQAENSVTVHLGSGRKKVGKVGEGAGFNGYALRTVAASWVAHDVVVSKTGEQFALASVQHSHEVHGRDIVRSTPLAAFLANPEAMQNGHEPAPKRDDTLYNVGEFENADYAWGMAIDLNRCIGCNACMVACQSENNIPVVGKEQVAAGRDMAWIRVDQYFEGDPASPRVHSQPVPCMHCENAPCELVCPVGATLHDHEGLNLQVYNRCVGTRYCSNNCPYKVRRFNFYRYADYDTPSLQPMRNPNVTVRWRGVMEKCTYCLQRISAARIASQLDNRRIKDGEIQTACQQVCPGRAITFGDIHDSRSAVSQLKASPRNYAMLGELNTRPRTTYLGRVRNVSPQLTEAG